MSKAKNLPSRLLCHPGRNPIKWSVLMVGRKRSSIATESPILSVGRERSATVRALMPASRIGLSTVTSFIDLGTWSTMFVDDRVSDLV